jgi:hypothetical protein
MSPFSVTHDLSGPGALTRGLMKLPRDRVRKIIVLEDYEQYYDWLKVSAFAHYWAHLTVMLICSDSLWKQLMIV